jgi:hypothetical protein
MRPFPKALLLAFVAFVAAFTFRFGYATWYEGQGLSAISLGDGAQASAFNLSRKNYASEKPQSVGPSQGDTQKFEKIGTLAASTATYDADRSHLMELIASTGSVIQLEQTQGLEGRRNLNLGVGVPPDRFDAFIDQARGIGRLTRLAVTKNDKTNEYLQLRAKRNTLEKARAALEALQQPGGKLEERLAIFNRLTEIEQQIQDLGVSLGDFDAANELCTVKLTLVEIGVVARVDPMQRHMRNAMRAFEWTAQYGLMAGLGLAALGLAIWLAALAAQLAGVLLRRLNAASAA